MNIIQDQVGYSQLKRFLDAIAPFAGPTHEYLTGDKEILFLYVLVNLFRLVIAAIALVHHPVSFSNVVIFFKHHLHHHDFRLDLDNSTYFARVYDFFILFVIKLLHTCLSILRVAK